MNLLASPMARHDFGHFVRCGCREALRAAADASTSPEPLHLRAQMDPAYVRRIIKGQARLSIDSFAVLATTLGLDPATVFRTAVEDATRILTESAAALAAEVQAVREVEDATRI